MPTARFPDRGPRCRGRPRGVTRDAQRGDETQPPPRASRRALVPVVPGPTLDSTFLTVTLSLGWDRERVPGRNAAAWKWGPWPQPQDPDGQSREPGRAGAPRKPPGCGRASAPSLSIRGREKQKASFLARRTKGSACPRRERASTASAGAGEPARKNFGESGQPRRDGGNRAPSLCSQNNLQSDARHTFQSSDRKGLKQFSKPALVDTL